MENISIKRRCVLDHIDQIKKYIYDNKTHNVMNNYNQGIKRYSEIKTLMCDITLHYPQLMGSLLKSPYTEISQTYTLDKQTLDSIITVFRLFKSLDLVKMKKMTDKILEKLHNIDERLALLSSESSQSSQPPNRHMTPYFSDEDNIIDMNRLNMLENLINDAINNEPTTMSYECIEQLILIATSTNPHIVNFYIQPIIQQQSSNNRSLTQSLKPFLDTQVS